MLLPDNIDSTEYRREVWEREYSTYRHLPSTKNTEFPSRALVSFLEKYQPIRKDLAIDLGSGNGRNSVYLAEQWGYKSVYGIEFAQSAIESSRKKIEALGLDSSIRFFNQSLGDPIRLPDECADLIIDMFTMHSLNEADRSNALSEIKRLLKPGGFYLISTIGAEGKAVQANIANAAGSEANSYRFNVEDCVVSEKAFLTDELSSLLDPLETVEIESIQQETVIEGQAYNHIYYNGVFRKI